MQSRQFSPLAFLLLLSITLSAETARATTVVAMTDEDLAVSARAIVEGTVMGVAPAWDAASSAVVTYVTLDVERVYKGDVPPGLVVLKQMGGSTRRASTVIFGAPEFEPSQRVLLFLNTDADGALHVAHLLLGDFRIVIDAASGQEIVVRSHGDATMLKSAAAGEVTERATHTAFVATMLATLDMNPEGIARYEAANAGVPIRLAPAEFEPVKDDGAPQEFTFLGSGFRWFEPDTNAKVRFKVNVNEGPTPSGGLNEAKAAFAAWSNVRGSSLRIEYAGSSRGGGLTADGENVVAFGDPDNRLDTPVNCSGVVGLGGVTSTYNESTMVGGDRFTRIAEGDLILADGFDCLLSDASFLGEIITHELGHALGLGHSSSRADEGNPVLRDATMFFQAHNDGRGASVREDDADAIRFLYPGVTSAPAPVLERATYKQAKSTLILSGLNLGAGASVTINGRVISPQSLRYSAAKGQLKVVGSTAELNLRTSSNSVVVTIDGRSSNALQF